MGISRFFFLFLLSGTLSVFSWTTAASHPANQDGPADESTDLMPMMVCGDQEQPAGYQNASRIVEACLITSSRIQISGSPVQVLRVRLTSGVVRDYVALGFYTDQKQSLENKALVLRSAIIDVTSTSIRRSFIYLIYDRQGTGNGMDFQTIYGYTPDQDYFYVSHLLPHPLQIKRDPVD